MAPLLRAIALGLLIGSTTVPVHAGNPEADKALGDGLGALWNKKYDDAVADFTTVIKLDPGNLYAYCNRCACYESLGRENLALEDANHAVALDPKSGYCALVRADVYLDLRDPKDALSDLDKAIERRPISTAFYHRGEAHSDLGQYDLAVKDYTQAISPTNVAEPADPDALDNSTAVIDLNTELPYYYRGLAHQKMGQFAEAETDLRKAAEQDPAVAARLAQEKAAVPTSALNLAIQAYTAALKEEPSDDGAYFDHARPGFPKHDFPAALTNLNAVVSQNPNDAQAHVDRGYADFKLNDYGKSVDDAVCALNIRPNNPDAYNNRGLVYLTTGQYDRAIDDYNEVIRLLYLGSTPADAHRQALAYCGLGKALGLKGDDVNAKVCFYLAVEFAPDFAIVYRFRADYEAAKEMDKDAIADYEHAVELNPKSAEALAGRAWLHVTSKTAALRDPASAVTDATAACDLTAWNDADLLSVLAAADAAAGDFAGAQKWQARAVAILDGEPDQAADTEAKRLLALYQAGKPYAAPQ